MSEHIDTKLCLDALHLAVQARRPSPGLIHHSDRGSQYASHDYRRALDCHGMLCSMSRKGDCWDSAVAESFWSTIKAELIDAIDFPTRSSAKTAIFEYIEAFYNRVRIQSHLWYMLPEKFEIISKTA
jgi:transposase InsO family protein